MAVAICVGHALLRVNHIADLPAVLDVLIERSLVVPQCHRVERILKNGSVRRKDDWRDWLASHPAPSLPPPAFPQYAVDGNQCGWYGIWRPVQNSGSHIVPSRFSCRADTYQPHTYRKGNLMGCNDTGSARTQSYAQGCCDLAVDHVNINDPWAGKRIKSSMGDDTFSSTGLQDPWSQFNPRAVRESCLSAIAGHQGLDTPAEENLPSN